METTITHLPPTRREEQLRRHGLDPSSRWSGVERAPSRAGQDAQEASFLRDGGWTIVDPAHEGLASGMTAHRSVLHPHEYVDHERLVGLVEDELGFSLDELHSVYSTGGRLPDHLRGLRGRVDARLLALSRAGANMELFRRITGLAHRTLYNALARARAAEGVAA